MLHCDGESIDRRSQRTGTRSEHCPHEDFITIKYTHRIIITIIIVLIKNYYVNSYLTTCMAQSITLVSCNNNNNNNKDTTIYLLVSLSSLDSRHFTFATPERLFTFPLLFTCIFLFSLFFFTFNFLRFPRSQSSPCYYIPPCIRLCTRFSYSSVR